MNQTMDDFRTCVAALREFSGESLHLKPGGAPRLRVGSRLESLPLPPIHAAWTESLVAQSLSEVQRARLAREHFLETSLSLEGIGRMRVRFFQQRGSIEMVARMVREGVPTLASLGLPGGLRSLHSLRSGLVVVAAGSGFGKTTTLAAMIQQINRYRPCHILCIDDPTEFLHRSQLALVDQIEVGRDATDQVEALKAASRQDAEVVVAENPTDATAVEQMLHLAETGHLVFTSVPVRSPEAVATWLLERPPRQQEGAVLRERLVQHMEILLVQTLVQRTDQSGRVLVSELHVRSEALARYLRGEREPMLEERDLEGTFDGSLIRLARDGTIPWSEAAYHAIDKPAIERAIMFD